MKGTTRLLTDRMGRLGFGGGAIGNLYRELPDADSSSTVFAALNHSIKYFDSAPHYGFGLSEKRLGRAFGQCADAQDIIVSTKVGRVLAPTCTSDLRTERQGFVSPEPFESHFDYGHEGVMRSFEESRRRLGREIDILFAHDLGRRTHGDQHASHMRSFLGGGYRALRELREQGVVRAIGIGVNEWQVCEEVLAEVELDIILLAGRYTLLEQDALNSFLPLCVRRGIAVVIGGPYNSGILASDSTAGHTSRYDYRQAPPHILARVASIQSVCKRHEVPLAAAALQFPLAHPAVVSVIPGMGSTGEVDAAVRWMSTRIPAAFWQELRAQSLISPDAPVPLAS